MNPSTIMVQICCEKLENLRQTVLFSFTKRQHELITNQSLLLIQSTITLTQGNNSGIVRKQGGKKHILTSRTLVLIRKTAGNKLIKTPSVTKNNVNPVLG